MIENLSIKILKACLSIMLFFLTVMSFIFTQRHGKEEWGEIENGAPIYQIRDSWIIHLVGLLFVILLFALIEYILKKQVANKEKWIHLLNILASAFAAICSFLILCGGQRTPIDDQAQVYSAASFFNASNYINLIEGGYLNMYPQQLGFVMFMQVVFRMFGDGNFYAVQMINCLFIGGIVYLASKCLKAFTDNCYIRVIFPIVCLGMVPLYLLSSWVYGDIPFLFFTFMLFYFYMSMCKQWSKFNFIMGILSACLCLLFRKNALIILIAISLVSIIFFIYQKNLKLLICSLVICLLPLLPVKLVEIYYSQVSGYEIDGGIPILLWVAMGVNEDGSKPGWFDNFGVTTYYANDCNKELSSQAASTRIKERIDLFIRDPIYCVSFYKRKICTQWNDPYFNTIHLLEVDEGKEAVGITGFLLKIKGGLLDYLSTYQFLIYFGALIYVIRHLAKQPFYKNCIILTIFGGFLFSILWEANSRYVFPYFVMMVPFAVIGWKDIYTFTTSYLYKLVYRIANAK